MVYWVEDVAKTRHPELLFAAAVNLINFAQDVPVAFAAYLAYAGKRPRTRVTSLANT